MKICYPGDQDEDEFFIEINNMLKLQKHQKSDYITKIENLIKHQDNIEGTGVRIVMELAQCNLNQLYSKSKSLLEPQLIYTLIKNILNGLKDIFSLNMFNRDIKPENILYYEKENIFKFADFGTSKIRLGQEIAVMGTYLYFSPEIYVAHYNREDEIKIDVFMNDIFCAGISFASAICKIENLDKFRDKKNGFINIKEQLQQVKDKKIYDPIVFEIVEKMIINEADKRKKNANMKDLLTLAKKLP